MGKKLKFVRISFLSSLVLLHGVSAKKPVYLFAKQVAADFVSDAPVGLKHVFPEGPLFGFVWMTSQEGTIHVVGGTRGVTTWSVELFWRFDL